MRLRPHVWLGGLRRTVNKLGHLVVAGVWAPRTVSLWLPLPLGTWPRPLLGSGALGAELAQTLTQGKGPGCGLPQLMVPLRGRKKRKPGRLREGPLIWFKLTLGLWYWTGRGEVRAMPARTHTSSGGLFSSLSRRPLRRSGHTDMGVRAASTPKGDHQNGAGRRVGIRAEARLRGSHRQEALRRARPLTG